MITGNPSDEILNQRQSRYQHHHALTTPSFNNIFLFFFNLVLSLLIYNVLYLFVCFKSMLKQSLLTYFLDLECSFLLDLHPSSFLCYLILYKL